MFLAENRENPSKIIWMSSLLKVLDASEESKFDPKATNCLSIGYSDNTSYILHNIKTTHLFSKNVRFNINNIPGFLKESKNIEEIFLYLDFDEVRQEVLDTSNSSELSSQFYTTKTEFSGKGEQYRN